MNSRKATVTQACTDRTLAFKVRGRLPPKNAMPAPNTARISTHNSMEPSWLPHTPVTLNSIGLSECELAMTLRTEKSDTT